jgi:hypothetical protein
VAFKEGSWRQHDEYVIIECRNKAKVIPADLTKFVGNMDFYAKEKKLDPELVKGYSRVPQIAGKRRTMDIT